MTRMPSLELAGRHAFSFGTLLVNTSKDLALKYLINTMFRTLRDPSTTLARQTIVNPTPEVWLLRIPLSATSSYAYFRVLSMNIYSCCYVSFTYRFAIHRTRLRACRFPTNVVLTPRTTGTSAPGRARHHPPLPEHLWVSTSMVDSLVRTPIRRLRS